MTSNVYVLKNQYLGVFELPQVQKLSKADVGEGYRRLIYSDPADCYKRRYQECLLCYIGTWDDEKGVFDYVTPEVIVDLATLFPKGYLAKRARAEQEAELSLQELC